MSQLKSVCVYCGSGFGRDPAYRNAAREVGQALGAAGIDLVYGGGDVGLMGTVAQAALRAGGHVTGIIPDFLQARERRLDEVQENLVVGDMHTRKMLMFDRANAFIALPGGIGTLEELIEQLTWAQLGRHTKPILLVSTNGFWTPLLGLLDHMREQGFLCPGLDPHYIVTEDAGTVLPLLREAVAARAPSPAGEELVQERF